VRHQFTRAGGNLGESGSVGWQFEAKGLISVNVSNGDAEEIALQAIDAGAEDVDLQGETIEIRTEPSDLESIRQQLESSGLEIENADYAMVPKVSLELDEKTAIQTLRLLDGLEDLEDVQRVYSNADFSDEALEAYAS
jgi:transcriptional/translational regulatory protein YebC/TACO1